MSNVIGIKDWQIDQLTAPDATLWVCGSRRDKKACRLVALLIQQISDATVRFKPASALRVDGKMNAIPKGKFSIWADRPNATSAITTAIRLPDSLTYKLIDEVDEYDMEELLNFLSGLKPIKNRSAKPTAPGGVA